MSVSIHQRSTMSQSSITKSDASGFSSRCHPIDDSLHERPLCNSSWDLFHGREEGLNVDERLIRIAEILEQIMESYNPISNATYTSPEIYRIQSSISAIGSEDHSPKVQECRNEGTEGMFEDLNVFLSLSLSLSLELELRASAGEETKRSIEMGSLMGGWDSRAVLERNKSMTKEDIEAFRSRQHKMHETGGGGQRGIEGDHSPVATAITRSSSTGSSPPQQQYMSETPEATEAASFQNNRQQFHKANTNGDWWTRSKWAFLNEPPVDEDSAHKYAAQFHVANLPTI